MELVLKLVCSAVNAPWLKHNVLKFSQVSFDGGRGKTSVISVISDEPCGDEVRARGATCSEMLRLELGRFDRRFP